MSSGCESGPRYDKAEADKNKKTLSKQGSLAPVILQRHPGSYFLAKEMFANVTKVRGIGQLTEMKYTFLKYYRVAHIISWKGLVLKFLPVIKILVKSLKK